MSWLWTLLMGVGMLLGSAMAFGESRRHASCCPTTSSFVGMSRHELAAVNARLLPFLTHDRVTLAGAMTAIGVLYVALSWFGSRRGRHWAQVAIVVSGVRRGSSASSSSSGSATSIRSTPSSPRSCFSLLVIVHPRPPGPPLGLPAPMLVEDAAWTRGLWGQLLLRRPGLRVHRRRALDLGHRRDPRVRARGPRVPRHDGAGAARRGHQPRAARRARSRDPRRHAARQRPGDPADRLWGFRPGERWLWWTLLLAGLPGYAAAIGVHYAVGYESPFHLAPAFGGSRSSSPRSRRLSSLCRP